MKRAASPDPLAHAPPTKRKRLNNDITDYWITRRAKNFTDLDFDSMIRIANYLTAKDMLSLFRDCCKRLTVVLQRADYQLLWNERYYSRSLRAYEMKFKSLGRQDASLKSLLACDNVFLAGKLFQHPNVHLIPPLCNHKSYYRLSHDDCFYTDAQIRKLLDVTTAVDDRYRSCLKVCKKMLFVSVDVYHLLHKPYNCFTVMAEELENFTGKHRLRDYCVCKLSKKHRTRMRIPELIESKELTEDYERQFRRFVREVMCYAEVARDTLHPWGGGPMLWHKSACNRDPDSGNSSYRYRKYWVTDGLRKCMVKVIPAAADKRNVTSPLLTYYRHAKKECVFYGSLGGLYVASHAQAYKESCKRLPGWQMKLLLV